jgi:hypothetical protein
MDCRVLRSNVVLVLLATAPVAGCTAGLAVGRIVTAQKAVRDAEAKGAPELAPYEYRLAVRHLGEAWEEHGDAEYKTSMAYADKARAYAEQAVVRTEGGGRELQDLRNDVEKLDDLLEEEVTPEAAPSGAPQATEAAPPPRREKPSKEEEEIEDFVDEAGDDEIEIEGDEPAPPPPPTKTQPAPKSDGSSPWGKRK